MFQIVKVLWEMHPDTKSKSKSHDKNHIPFVFSFLHIQLNAIVTIRLYKYLQPENLVALARSSLVPVFAFGENNLFHQVSNPEGSRLRDIQNKIQSWIAFAPALFYGRGIFQYTFGMLPYRRPVNVVGMSQSILLS